MGLEIEKKLIGNNVVVLEMAGRITLGRDCQQIETQVDELVRERQTRVIFDLSKIRHMDSTGIGMLVMCSGKLKDAAGELRLAGATGIVGEMLKLTRMDAIVPIFASVQEALAGLSDATHA